MKNEQLAQQIARTRRIANRVNKRLFDLMEQCKHSVAVKDAPRHVKLYDSYEFDDWGGAYCENCGQDHGWYCPDSPDHTCHYYSQMDENGERFVQLIDGSKHFLGLEHLQRWETYDCCLFCGEPEERK